MRGGGCVVVIVGSGVTEVEGVSSAGAERDIIAKRKRLMGHEEDGYSVCGNDACVIGFC